MKPLLKTIARGLAVAALCTALPALAELCGKCKEKVYTKDIGTCAECTGITTSGQFQLCMDCSLRLRQCEHCRAALPAAKVDLENGGTYRAGRWTYEVAISGEGTRSQGVYGKLAFNGAPVTEPSRINDFHETPWGPLYWVGQPIVQFGAHGWMPKPLVREKVGERLPPPGSAAREVANLRVSFKAIAPDRQPGSTVLPIEPWIAAELTKRGVKSPRVELDWTPLGPDRVTLVDNRQTGLSQIWLGKPHDKQFLTVEVDGGQIDDSFEPTVDLPRQPDVNRVVRCRLQSTVAIQDLYLAFKVEAAP